MNALIIPTWCATSDGGVFDILPDEYGKQRFLCRGCHTELGFFDGDNVCIKKEIKQKCIKFAHDHIVSSLRCPTCHRYIMLTMDLELKQGG
jgi:hypothetical protein